MPETAISAFSVIVPARNAKDEIAGTIESLLHVPEETAVSIVVVSNGDKDGAIEVAESWRDRVEATGGALVIEHLDEQGKARAIRRGLELAGPGPVMLIDTRVRVTEGSIGRMLEEIATGAFDVVSARLVYQPSPSPVVSAFSRGYAATPYGRSTDVKGTCVMFAESHRPALEALPDLAADDRYFVASTTRDRRTMVDGAFVKYFFPKDAAGLMNQQVRWVRANSAFDAAVDDYDRNAHEDDRWPYFGDERPDIAAIAVYGVVSVVARVVAKLRPDDRLAW